MLHLADNLNRLGTETAFEVLARAADLAAKGKDIINLGIGQPDFKTPPHIVGLPPGMITTLPGSNVTPWRRCRSAVTASRSGRMPLAGV